MVDIQSKEIIDKMSRDLKVQPAMQLPRELGKQILPVYNVNPERLVQVKSALASDVTEATIHTTHSEKDTFLIGYGISIAKSALSTSLFSRILATPFGQSAQNIVILRTEPLTAENVHADGIIAIPLKLERGIAITITNSTAIASIDTHGIIYFYETDPQ